jgi:ABC-2 type transport system permease protein
MIRATRAELLKLRTTRMPWGLLTFSIAVTVLHTLLFDSNAGGTGHTAIASLATHAGQRQAISIPAEVLLLATVLGVIIASGEYRLRTATNTYLATPNRAQVLAAKVLAAAALGSLFGLAGAAVTTGIGLSYTTANGHHIVLSTATILRYAAGATFGAALLAAAGVGLGSLIRSQTAAITAVFVWGFVVEQTIEGASATAQHYLPYTAAASLAGTNLGSGTPLPFVAAAALVAAVAALISLTAARTLLNADIT